MADFGICAAPGCDKPAYTRKLGLCGMHASRLRRGGKLERRKPHLGIWELVGGRTVGHWTVLSEGEPYVRPDNGGEMRRALCRCTCGTVRLVAAHKLKNRGGGSCGCRQAEINIALRQTHGMSNTSEYRSWCKLRERCLNPNDKSYPHYGGRGISVCDAWLAGFEAFYADMGPKPSPDHSIDRIDVNGNYEPSNCRWATNKVQGRNKRVQRIVHYQGRDMTLAEACEIAGMSMKLVHGRMAVQKMSFDDAISQPVMTAKEASTLGTAAKRKSSP